VLTVFPHIFLTMSDTACCTCATLLSAIPPLYDEKTEKPVAQDRQLDCCGRVICRKCIAVYIHVVVAFRDWSDIPPGQFAFRVLLYAPPISHKRTGWSAHNVTPGPFCQISTGPSSLPSQGLRDPPAYSMPPSPQPAYAALASPRIDDEPPAYSATNTYQTRKQEYPLAAPAEDVLHFLDPSQDTILSLSLRYGVPHDALRRKNNIFADHLLAARRTILIPGEFYKGGVSLSPEPLEDEEEEIRKTKVRRWMVACKVAE